MVSHGSEPQKAGMYVCMSYCLAHLATALIPYRASNTDNILYCASKLLR